MKLDPKIVIIIAVVVILFIIFRPMISGYNNTKNNIIVRNTIVLQDELKMFIQNGAGRVDEGLLFLYNELRRELGRDPYSLFGFRNNRRIGWPNTLSKDDASYWIDGMNNIANRYSRGVRNEYMFMSHLLAYDARPTNTFRERFRLQDQMRRFKIRLDEVSSNGVNPDSRKIEIIKNRFITVFRD